MDQGINKGVMIMKKILLIACALCCASTSYAESPWLVKLGVSDVVPKRDGGTLAGMQASSSNDVQFTPSVEYAFNPALSAELLLAAPLGHNVTLNGIRVVKLKELPPTLSLKYRFPAIQGIQPYFGLGVNYTMFWDEKTEGPVVGSKLNAINSLGMAGLIGAEYRIPKSPFGIAVDIRYIDIVSKVKLDGNKIGDLTINPWVLGAGVTYRF
ncbi:OmpW family protein [Aquirhabdus parva]|uniref:OmpW family protein n=2 Tax=Aquirhabdus parva TaxID=2283318 RepID=A0A345P9W0_9GAMM|nr:OmpW family protein [Aquirhabdus parva]